MSHFALKFGLLLLVALTFGAGIYKWVDEKGVTHYSQSPPIAKKSLEIKAAPTTPTADKSAAPFDKTWQQQGQEFQRRRLERDAADKKRAEEEAAALKQAVARKSLCITAQQNLHVLQMQKAVYVIDERGERVFIEDKDRPAWIARMKSQIGAYCSSQK